MKPVIIGSRPLGPSPSPWETDDPFLFCVHHRDEYPAAAEGFGPARASLAGRNMGMDFEGRDGWRMYHGDKVPGFPYHPHRGFETVTLARQGTIDHSDSLGAAARFGNGDVQWLTAGAGILHSEMFPLLDKDKPNPVELFQIWLNLPAADKMVKPYFSMLWSGQVPKVLHHDKQGRAVEVTVMAGALGKAVPPKPPPNSWASRPDAHVAIWAVKLVPNAQWSLPAAAPGLNRTLYFFKGQQLGVASTQFTAGTAIRVRSDAELQLENGAAESEVLVLQGKPIGEPVAKYGPFVMNTPQEIEQAFADYRRTEFGGWPWPSHEPVHSREGRFAKHADGRVEKMTG
ncbi:MAG: pirin family protein [Myxococcaceae bacterium]|nr:pirin family protein [Myxococcaceae bacterium]